MSESEPNTDPPLVTRPPEAAEPPLVTRPPELAEAPPAPVPPRPRPGFWEALLWCLVFLAGQISALVLVLVAVFAAYALAANDPKTFTDEQLNGLKRATEHDGPDAPPMPRELAHSFAWGMLAAQFTSLAMIAVVLPRRIGRDWKRQLGVRRPYWLHLILVVLIVPGFVVIPEVIQSAFRSATGMQPQGVEVALKGIFGSFPWALTLLAVAVGPGVVEEFWCRGFLGRGLCARYGVSTGVLFASLFFALMHMDPSQLLVYTCMGAYLHFLYLATRSIWMPILLHAMNNGTAIVLALTLSPEKLAEPTPVVVPIAAFALLLFGSVALWTSRAVEEREAAEGGAAGRSEAWQPEYPGISAPPPGAGVRLAHAAVSPVALLFTLVAFGVMIYLAYRFVL